MKQKSVLILLLDLYKFLDRRRKFQVFLIFLLAIFSSSAELITIGSLIPFVDLMIEPTRLFKYSLLEKLFTFYEVNDLESIMIFMTTIFIFLIVISTLTRMFINYFTIIVVHGIGHDLSINIFKNTIYQPYQFHINNNTSKTIANLSRGGASIGVLHLVVQSLVSLLLSLSIIFMLLYIDFKLTIIGGSILVSFYVLISLFFKRLLFLNSFQISQNEESRVKNIQESIGGIRETIIGNMYNLFISKFRKIDWAMNKALIKNSVISIIPSHLIMMIAMTSLILVIFYKSFVDGSLVDSLPIVGGLILGAQKLIPQLQIVYSSWSKAQGNYKIIEEILIILNKVKSNIKIKNSLVQKMPFNKEIRVKSLSFKHQNSKKNIFENVSFVIKKNHIIGISGSTGCGKSTLIDCLIGLLKSTSGSIKIDNIRLNKSNVKNWQKNISHVPQSIYVADLSIQENIAFGLDNSKIDRKKLIESCKISEIYDFIKSKRDGFNYIVGEKGGRLSGGQKQRIGIARALYLEKELLILDESTNALDDSIEEKILNNLKKFRKDTTIIHITHKKSLIKYFDSHFAFTKNGFKRIK
ncbi:ABC transporter ATP-binding protein [Candidatus Pelagibacter sp.]|nr:ABC transporter ATP-binding protein [Candidatus Pelagibacter sp.]